ncbi:MAG TPA: autotransporter domain-containing protein [Luteibacter sp.]|nr:autotransporter domain-containing protein [Luteibacter sp.]
MGAAGNGDTRFVGQDKNDTASLTMALGGDGGSGAAGGNVTATNEGNILTISDNANGIFAQSVGGGGGVAGAATAKGTGSSHSETMTLTGASGAGGNGGVVTANNLGNVLTIGGDAAAIYAQSIGGGGGKAGSATTAGLPATTATLAAWLANSTSLNTSLQSYAGVQALASGAWTPFDMSSLRNISSDYLAYAATLASDVPDATQGNAAVTMNTGGGSGGGKGTAGNGQAVNVTNLGGMLETHGPLSAGIFAQSVGGGGGDAGSTQVQTLKAGAEGMNATMTLGGRALNTGDGGVVSVRNVDASISTQGDASYGIFAQSLGGGGGHSTLTSSGFASVDGTPTALTLGGDYGTYGNGGNVYIVHAIDASSKSAFINTTGNDAVAIVAQSIGGGGGDIVVMHTKANAGGYSVGDTDQTQDQMTIAVGGTHLPNIASPPLCPGMGDGHAFSGCGNGGSVNVTTTTASINTGTGRNAHGILAQSIGGGGGWIVGVTYAGTDPFASNTANGLTNYAKMAGDGGSVNVNVTGEVITGGDGAYGILAQSVGGGGVLGGDLANGGPVIAFPLDINTLVGPATNRWGDGGAVNVTVNGYLVQTKGANAPAIFAQSVGGGGGLMASTSGMMMGTAQGTGYAGPININNNDGVIQALGNGSSAIVVNSEGHPDSGDNSHVSIANSGSILGNATAPVIVLSGKGNRNGSGQIANNGLIAATDANNNPVAGMAISVTDNSFAVVNNNVGAKIYGGIDVGAKGKINSSGYWDPSPSNVGDVVNAGIIDLDGGTGNTATQTVINGSLNTTGTIKQGVDFQTHSATSLTATKGITLGEGGTILIVPYTLASTPQILLSNVTSAAAHGANVQDASSYLFAYNATIDSHNNLVVSPVSKMNLRAQETGAGSNIAGLSQALDKEFNDPNITHAQAAALAAVNDAVTDATSYRGVLSNLQSEGAQAASVAHVVASDAFVERMNSCPLFEDSAQLQREHDCLWGRVIASNGDQDAANNTVGYHQNGQVLQIGGQKEVASDWFVGGSVSADNSNLNTRASWDSVDGKGWTAGMMAKHQMGNWLVSAAFEGGEMSYDSRREAQLGGLGGIAHASFDVSHFGLHSRISDQIAFQNWYLKPYIDLHATHIDSDGYTERGAGTFDLQVASSHTNVLGASPMIEAGRKFTFDNGMALQVYGGIGATFYNDGRLGADMQYVDSSPGVGGFHVTSDLPQNRFKSTAGLDWKTSVHWDMRLEYAGEHANHFESNTGSLKATYKFG